MPPIRPRGSLWCRSTSISKASTPSHAAPGRPAVGMSCPHGQRATRLAPNDTTRHRGTATTIINHHELQEYHPERDNGAHHTVLVQPHPPRRHREPQRGRGDLSQIHGSHDDVGQRHQPEVCRQHRLLVPDGGDSLRQLFQQLYPQQQRVRHSANTLHRR